MKLSHAPHGACELKSYAVCMPQSNPGHAPHGACELK